MMAAVTPNITPASLSAVGLPQLFDADPATPNNPAASLSGLFQNLPSGMTPLMGARSTTIVAEDSLFNMFDSNLASNPGFVTASPSMAAAALPALSPAPVKKEPQLGAPMVVLPPEAAAASTVGDDDVAMLDDAASEDAAAAATHVQSVEPAESDADDASEFKLEDDEDDDEDDDFRLSEASGRKRQRTRSGRRTSSRSARSMLSHDDSADDGDGDGDGEYDDQTPTRPVTIKTVRSLIATRNVGPEILGMLFDEKQLTSEERKQWKRLRRMVKNRQSAQLSRQRKREYMGRLEGKVSKLEATQRKLEAKHHNAIDAIHTSTALLMKRLAGNQAALAAVQEVLAPTIAQIARDAQQHSATSSKRRRGAK